MMVNTVAYIILIVAVVLGTAANGFAKSAQGFTLLLPSIITAITIIGCMFALSVVMKSIPVGVTYASFAGLCIVATSLVGIIKFNQIPNTFVIIGLGLIVAGVLMVNLLGKTNL
jgi:small multidrug resistance pump